METTMRSTFGRSQTCENTYHIMMNMICASCRHKDCMIDGTRVCQKMGLKVEQKFRCKQWQISDGLKNAGKGGGVVRLKGTAEIVIR